MCSCSTIIQKRKAEAALGTVCERDETTCPLRSQYRNGRCIARYAVGEVFVFAHSSGDRALPWVNGHQFAERVGCATDQQRGHHERWSSTWPAIATWACSAPFRETHRVFFEPEVREEALIWSQRSARGNPSSYVNKRRVCNLNVTDALF